MDWLVSARASAQVAPLTEGHIFIIMYLSVKRLHKKCRHYLLRLTLSAKKMLESLCQARHR